MAGIAQMHEAIITCPSQFMRHSLLRASGTSDSDADTDVDPEADQEATSTYCPPTPVRRGTPAPLSTAQVAAEAAVAEA